MNDLNNQANALGFRRIYLLKPAPYPHFKKRRIDGTLHENSNHVSDDPVRDYPWANALLLLIYPYHPYPETASVSGYYPASNSSYHAASALMRCLAERGIRAERAHLPVRETLLRHGIGIACKNGLTAVEPFGTRFVVQTIMISAPSEWMQYRTDRFFTDYQICSNACSLCRNACPTSAITPSASGLCFSDCIRAKMETKQISQETMESMQCLLGCEQCQFACPLNKGIPVNEDVPEAFSFERILSGDVKEAYRLIGRNLHSGGRLEQQTLILAANDKRKDLLPLIYPWMQDSRPQIVQAAAYAISVLQSNQE